MDDNTDFRLHWGKHSGKSLDVILQEDPTYFDYFVGQRVNVLDIYPELRIALNARNGLADKLETRRPALMRKEADRLLQKGDPHRVTVQDKHPELQNLRRKQREEGLNILQQLKTGDDQLPAPCPGR